MIKPLWAPQAGRGRWRGGRHGSLPSICKVDFPLLPRQLGSRLFALFIGQSSAFQYGKSNSHSNITSGSRIRRLGRHSAHYSFILFRSVVGETRKIHKLCNQRVLLRDSRCGRWRRGKGNMRGSDGRRARGLSERSWLEN